MPVEEMARRGRETLRFGPMKPVGLRRPAHRTRGRTPSCSCAWRIAPGRMWNLVGFQTRLRTPEQQRVFRMIPGLAERGVPALRLHPPQLVPQRARRAARRTSRCATTRMTLFAGQLTGVEGYTESTATGLLAGINLSRMLAGEEPVRSAADDDARRAVSLPARGGSATLPADERELRSASTSSDAPVRDKRRKQELPRRARARGDDRVARRERLVASGRTRVTRADARLDAGRARASRVDAASVSPPTSRCRVPRASRARSAMSRPTRCIAYERDLASFVAFLGSLLRRRARGRWRASTASRCADSSRT